MPDGHGNRNGGARPFVPFIDMQVCAADTGMRYANQDVVNTDGGFGDIHERESRRAVRFYKSFHFSYGSSGLSLYLGKTYQVYVTGLAATTHFTVLWAQLFAWQVGSVQPTVVQDP